MRPRPRGSCARREFAGEVSGNGNGDELRRDGAIALAREGSDEVRAAEAEPRRRGGIIVARLSSREMQGGETHAQQLLDCWDLAARNRIEISHVITCLNYKSELEDWERYDFEFIRERLALGSCEAVLFREPERVARRIKVAYSFYEELEQDGAQLWLSDFGYPIDWDNDSHALHLAFKQAFGQTERAKIVRAMERAKRRRWLDEGRGWPGALRFGFRRDPKTRFPEWDPEQWWVVKFIHTRYRDACQLQRGRAQERGHGPPRLAA